MAGDAIRVPRLLRVRDLSELTGLARWRIYELIAEGKGPPHIRIGATIRFPEDAIVKWIESLTKHAQGGA